MGTANLTKVCFNKSSSTMDYATQESLADFFKVLKAKSNLPINQLLSLLSNKEADTVSASREDTNYSFFASKHRNVVSVVIKKLGEENIEFDIPSNELDKLSPLPQL
jgi:BioD-like phosphotransacetylase family protein